MRVQAFFKENGKDPVLVSDDEGKVRKSDFFPSPLAVAISTASEYSEEYDIDLDSWESFPGDGGEEHRFRCKNGVFSVIIR